MPETPSVDQQIAQIADRVLPPASFSANVPSEIVDGFLRTGSGRRDSVIRIIHYCSLDLPEEEKVRLIKREYMSGSKGLLIDGKRYSMRYDEDGIRFFTGDTINFSSSVITWKQTVARITELLEAGQFAQQGLLETVNDQALQGYAQTLWYMRRDLDKNIDDTVFGVFAITKGSFDEEVASIVSVLKNPEQRAELVQRLNILSEMYTAAPDIMRFRAYRPDNVAEMFSRLLHDNREFTAQPGFIPETYPAFVTAEQTDSVLTSGGPYSDSRLSIYSFFLTHGDQNERAEFLKNFYGTGGRMPALSYNDAVSVDYSSRGLRILIGHGPDATALAFSWPSVARRIGLLMDSDHYLTSRDHERMPQYERERLAEHIASFYEHIPEEFTSPYPALERTERAEQIVQLLGDDAQLDSLIENMTEILGATPLNDRQYEYKVRVLADTRDFAEGIGFKPIPCPAGRDMQVQEKLNTGERPSLKSALRDKKDLAQATVKKAVEAAVGKRKREALE